MPPQEELPADQTKSVTRSKLNQPLVMVAVLGIVAGVVIGILVSQNPKVVNAPTGSKPSNVNVSQVGVTQGKLVKVSGEMLTVQDEKGQNVSIKAGKEASLYVYKDRVTPPMLVDEASALPVGREVRVNTATINGQLTATTVTVLP